MRIFRFSAEEKGNPSLILSLEDGRKDEPREREREREIKRASDGRFTILGFEFPRDPPPLGEGKKRVREK